MTFFLLCLAHYFRRCTRWLTRYDPVIEFVTFGTVVIWSNGYTKFVDEYGNATDVYKDTHLTKHNWLLAVTDGAGFGTSSRLYGLRRHDAVKVAQVMGFRVLNVIDLQKTIVCSFSDT